MPIFYMKCLFCYHCCSCRTTNIVSAWDLPKSVIMVVPATILPAQEEGRGCLLPVLDCSLFESAALAATIQGK